MPQLLPYLRAMANQHAYLVAERSGKKVFSTPHVFFDVGANIGDDADNIIHSWFGYQQLCQAFSHEYRIVSVEASPIVFCETMKFFELSGAKVNERRGKWIGLNVALSDTLGTMKFTSWGTSGGGKLMGELEPKPDLTITRESLAAMQTCNFDGNLSENKRNNAEVQVFTLDLLYQRLVHLGTVPPGGNVMALKIDVEGFEFRVLSGAAGLLQQKRIQFVVYETSGRPMNKIPDLMESFGYMCFFYAPDMLIPMSTSSWWYPHLEVTKVPFANALCSPKNGTAFRTLWRMYHAADEQLLQALDFL